MGSILLRILWGMCNTEYAHSRVLGHLLVITGLHFELSKMKSAQ